MKRVSNWLFIIPFIFLLQACSDEDYDYLPDAEPIVLDTKYDNKISGDNDFAFTLFKTVNRFDNSNVCISPLSVGMSLSMALNGAAGKTLEEIETVLEISGYSPAEVNEYAQTLREALVNADPSSRLSFENSIWYRLGFYVENSFVHLNQKYHKAEISALDFRDAGAVTRVNERVAKKTNNKITEIINEIPDDMIMYFINTACFKGSWKFGFLLENTHTQPFFSDSNEMRDVQMMRQTGSFGYYMDENASYLELPYGNGAFSMTILLPHKEKSVAGIIDDLNSAGWEKINSGLKQTVVNVQLPRFKVECDYDLQDQILPDLGMQSPFIPRLADFRGINKNRDLYISNIKHKTMIEVDEDGLVPAGFKISESPSVEYIMNKPFAFIIKEKSTGIILFTGKINHPEV